MSSGVGIIEAPQQDVANLDLELGREDVLEQAIDIERFAAVPEHDGNLQRLIERYGDNPGSCPYIKSMGEAGIQLVQKLAEAEKSPDRGPTIRELMEAKKREAQNHSTVIEKPNSTKNAEIAATTKTDTKIKDTRPDNKAAGSDTVVEEHLVTQGRAARIMAEAVEQPARPIPESTEEPKVKAIEIGLSDFVVAETEDVLQRQALDIEVGRISELKESHDQASLATETIVDINVAKELEVAKPVSKENVAHLEKQSDPVMDLVAKALAVEITDNTTNHVATEEEARDTTIELENVAVEDRPLDINEIMAALGIEYPESDTTRRLEGATELLADTGKGPEVNIETSLGEASLDLTPDTAVSSLKKPIVELAETTVETEETIDLRAELNSYIETLEPSKAEAAEAALKSLTEALEANHERKGDPAESSAIEIKEIEHIFVELLEALNLDYADETVKKLIQSLFTPELLAEITEDYELSIDQLNYLGTREYKPASITSLFSHLLQLIKQKARPYLQLGKYALAISGSYRSIA